MEGLEKSPLGHVELSMLVFEMVKSPELATDQYGGRANFSLLRISFVINAILALNLYASSFPLRVAIRTSMYQSNSITCNSWENLQFSWL